MEERYKMLVAKLPVLHALAETTVVGEEKLGDVRIISMRSRMELLPPYLSKLEDSSGADISGRDNFDRDKVSVLINL